MTERIKDAAFAKEIEKVILDCLENRGFKRFRKDSTDMVLSDDFAIWTGLNRGVYPVRVSFSPHIGVHAFKIERLTSQLDKSRKYDRGTATFSRALVKFGMTLEQCNFFNDG